MTPRLASFIGFAFFMSTVAGCRAFTQAFATPDVVRAAFAPSIQSVRFLNQDWHLFDQGEPVQVVFKSQVEVDAFLARRPPTIVNQRGQRLATLPTVDFSHEVGILVIGNFKPIVTSLEITSIEEQDTQWLVHSVQWVNRPDQGGMLSFSQPSYYVAAPLTDKPIVFAPLVEANQDNRPVTLAAPGTPAPFPSASGHPYAGSGAPTGSPAP